MLEVLITQVDNPWDIKIPRRFAFLQALIHIGLLTEAQRNIRYTKVTRWISVQLWADIALGQPKRITHESWRHSTAFVIKKKRDTTPNKEMGERYSTAHMI